MLADASHGNLDAKQEDLHMVGVTLLSGTIVLATSSLRGFTDSGCIPMNPPLKSMETQGKYSRLEPSSVKVTPSLTAWES
jgi:hypothetical protein